MRQAIEDVRLLSDPDNNLITISFGANYCTEHECGIAGIKRALQVDGVFNDEYVERKANKSCPENLVFLDDGGRAILALLSRHDYKHGNIDEILKILRTTPRKQPLWDRGRRKAKTIRNYFTPPDIHSANEQLELIKSIVAELNKEHGKNMKAEFTELRQDYIDSVKVTKGNEELFELLEKRYLEEYKVMGSWWDSDNFAFYVEGTDKIDLLRQAYNLFKDGKMACCERVDRDDASVRGLFFSDIDLVIKARKKDGTYKELPAGRINMSKGRN